MNKTWEKALRFAALSDAATVSFERRFERQDGVATTAYRLQSYKSDGTVIGDARDYDLLKAAITPLERLSEQEDADDFIVKLDLITGQFTRS